MKTIGMIGGMSWESSLEYYRIINEETRKALGDTHSAKCLLHSFDFYDIELLQYQGKWDELTKMLVEKAMNIKSGGADFILICANTMHMMADEVEKKSGLKVLHIAETTGKWIQNKNLDKVLMLGSKFIMDMSFYKNKLNEMGIEVILPNNEDQVLIHDVIYKELIKGMIKDESRRKFIEIIQKSVKEGAQGVVLGCTEIPLLIKQKDLEIPVFDTVTIHCKEAVKYALNNNEE